MVKVCNVGKGDNALTIALDLATVTYVAFYATEEDKATWRATGKHVPIEIDNDRILRDK